MRKFKLGDVVTFKASPNSGQMVVQELLTKIFGGSDENPMYECKFYDEDKKVYIHDRFLENTLELVKH